MVSIIEADAKVELKPFLSKAQLATLDLRPPIPRTVKGGTDDQQPVSFVRGRGRDRARAQAPLPTAQQDQLTPLKSIVDDLPEVKPLRRAKRAKKENK